MITNDYKEMIKTKKKLNTLDYVFHAMKKDLDEMKEVKKMKDENYNCNLEEGSTAFNLRERITELLDKQITPTYNEYKKLLDVVYPVAPFLSDMTIEEIIALETTT